MNDLTVWTYENAEVRTIVKDGVPWWVLKDVCKVLELTTTARVAERLEDDEVSQTHIIDAQNRKQLTTIINESGLYSVILRSDKPKAKNFRRWVTHEVLPAIRQTGSYSLQTNRVMQLPDMKSYLAGLESRPHFPEIACKVLIQDYFLKHLGFAPALEEIRINELTSQVSEKNGKTDLIHIWANFSIGEHNYHMKADNGIISPKELCCNDIGKFGHSVVYDRIIED